MNKSTDYRKILGMITDEQVLALEQAAIRIPSSSFKEHELADYIASRSDWHIATLALSVNMQGFELETFRERVSYMVNKVAAEKGARGRGLYQ